MYCRNACIGEIRSVTSSPYKLSPSGTCCFQMSTPSLPPSITPVPWKVFYSIHVVSDVHAFPAPVDHSRAVEGILFYTCCFSRPRLPCPRRSLPCRGRYSILYMLFSDVHAFPAPVDHSCAVEGILFYTCCFQTSTPSLPLSIPPVPWKVFYSLNVVFRRPRLPCPRRSLPCSGRYSILYMLFQMSMPSLPPSITPVPWKKIWRLSSMKIDR